MLKSVREQLIKRSYPSRANTARVSYLDATNEAGQLISPESASPFRSYQFNYRTNTVDKELEHALVVCCFRFEATRASTDKCFQQSVYLCDGGFPCNMVSSSDGTIGK